MLRIAALSVAIALGISAQAATAGSFSVDLPRVTFTSASTETGTPATPELVTRGHAK